MKLFKKLSYWADNFIRHEYSITKEGLAIYRICYAAFFLLFGIPSFSWITKNPDIFFNPPEYSLAVLFSSFPPYEFFLLLDVLLIILFIFLLFGYKTTASSILITILWVIGNSFKYSFGKIDHDIIPVITPFILAFAGWGRAFSLDAQSQSEGAESTISLSGLPITLMAVIIGMGFFSAGMPKLFSWIDFNLTTQGVRDWIIRSFYVVGRKDFLISNFANIENPYFWESMDFIVVAFETTFIVATLKRSSFRLYLCLAIFFHFGNYLILNIPFTTYLIVYLLFIDWAFITNEISSYNFEKLFNVKNLFILITGYLILTSLILSTATSLTTRIAPIHYILGFLFNDPSKILQIIIYLMTIFLILFCLLNQHKQKNLNRLDK